MSGEIRVSDAVAEATARTLRQELGAYGSFGLVTLRGQIPDAAAADHDGRISSLMREALSSYVGVMEADASQVVALGNALSATDASVASRICAGRVP